MGEFKQSFSQEINVVVCHNLGEEPTVDVLGEGCYPYKVVHLNNNTLVVSFESYVSGMVLLNWGKDKEIIMPQLPKKERISRMVRLD